jgi:hypothetical protein
VLPLEEDSAKAESANVFYEKWQRAKADKKYMELKAKHLEMYEKRGKK